MTSGRAHQMMALTWTPSPKGIYCPHHAFGRRFYGTVLQHLAQYHRSSYERLRQQFPAARLTLEKRTSNL